MASGKVRLAGRFPPGTKVALVEVRDESVLRAEGGKTLERKKVGEDGTVEFASGVEVGGRYFITGQVRGEPLEVRISGKANADDSLSQAPVQPDRVRLSDGSWLDEPPEQHQKTGSHLFSSLGQHQVPKGTVQRSDTPRGTAHPVDTEDQEPTRRQEDVNGPVQASDTETGSASELVLGPQRQEDVPKGVIQRSCTPTGVATPIPSDPVEATRLAESSLGREARGEKGKAFADPLDSKGLKVGAPTGATHEESVKRHKALWESEREAAQLVDEGQPGREEDDGLDAQGQPLYEDAAAAAGVESADKPAEAGADRSAAGKKAARTRRRNERAAREKAELHTAKAEQKSTTAKKE